MKMVFGALFVVIFFAIGLAEAHAGCIAPDCIEFPADAGALNVRDFGAKGDGVTDDTDAINAALSASGNDTGPTFWHDRIVYFPDGTYLVSAPVVKRYANGKYGSGAILIGQSRHHTIIRLKDRTYGYHSAVEPRAIIFTASKLLDGSATSGGKDYENFGEGNDAFMNFVENMTIDVGIGNPGAIGIDYLANNMGAIRNVTLVGKTGVTGIALTRKWPGPALIQDVTIQGFDVGIDVAQTEYGITLDNVTLSGQRRIGLRNDRNAVAAHRLTITGAPSPVINASPDGLIVIVDGSINRAKPIAGDAIQNKGYAHIRNVAVSGYGSALGIPAPRQVIDGVYDRNTFLSASTQPHSLPVASAPVVEGDAVNEWVSVAAHGAKPDSQEDSTEAIRKAFESGASTVYFPHGTYFINDNIIVPPTVRRIVGMTSTIRVMSERSPNLRRDHGMFRVQNDRYSLIIEKLAFDNSYLGMQAAVEALGAQSLLLHDVVGAGVTTLKRHPEGGEVFLENTCCGLIDIAGKKGVWAKQLNTEGGLTRIRNNGAPLSILGLKTEGNCIALENTGGAKTEVLGGLLYIVQGADPATPAFRNVDSHITLSYVEEAFDPKNTYAVHLVDIQKDIVHKTEAKELPRRNVSRMVPGLYGR